MKLPLSSAAIAIVIALAAPAAAQIQMPQVIFPSPPLPGAAELERKLDQSKVVDGGRRLEWVWIDAHGGFEQLGLTTFKGDASFAPGKTSSSGAVVGVGVGARLLFFTLLARARLGIGPIGHFYRVGGEVGFHIPLGRVEPHVELGGGYATFGHMNDPAASPLAIRGGYGRVGVGLDYFVASVFSIGASASAEILALGNGAASSVGGSLAATGVLGLHF